MASYQVPAPAHFSFQQPQEWTRWLRRFERFRQASDLDKKSDEKQVNALIYAMGDEADDILKSFHLSEADAKKYKTVKERFDEYFIRRRNVIYERAKFNQRVQQPQESVDSFVTALHCLAEHCSYSDLHDEMICDRIVVGLKDASVAQKLQMDHDLTLDKAVTLARQSEAVKTQQSIVRPPAIDDSVSIEAIKSNRLTHRKKPQKSIPGMQRQDSPMCTRCGKSPPHTKDRCPAKDAVCRRCSKKGHYQKFCRSKNTSESAINQIEEDDAFLGVVSSNKSLDPWLINLCLNKQTLKFKIDTGADVTVIPASMYNKFKHGPLEHNSRLLKGADQQVLQVTGSFKGKLSYKNTESLEDIFVIQGLQMPLVGRPAMSSLNLVARITLIQTDRDTIVNKYPQLLPLGQMTGEYRIKLQPHTTPFALTTPRRIAIPLRPRVKEELERMEKLGVIAKVKQATDWCAGMVVVPKANGKVRICVDLTKLDANVCRERHILPSVEETLAQLGDAKVFTKLDANSGFWQIKLAEESALLTTFITPFGRYCFRRLPFGISSAPEVFQRKMSEILSGLEGVLCLIDDVLVIGKDLEEHSKRLESVLEKLSESKITLNYDKCEFAKSEIKFIGEVIDQNGVRPDPQKVKAITEIPQPNNRTEVRRFLGMASQLSKFCPQLSEQVKPIRDLLSSKNEWLWSDQQQKSFEFIKKHLSTSPILALFDPEKETIISSDASSYGLGAVLKQKQPGGERRPIAYISRSLKDTEQRYAQVEKEALALTWACERLSNYLVGTKFLIETDHKPLVLMLSTKRLDELPVRIQRFRMRMMRFQYSIVHVPGKALLTADALSRAPLLQTLPADQQLLIDSDIYVTAILQNLPVTDKRLTEIKKAQEQDAVCETVKQACIHGWPDQSKLKGEIKQYAPEASHLTIQDGILLYDDRLVIPTSLQHEILVKLHAGHQGIQKCKKRAHESVWWPGIGKAVTQFIERCSTCSIYRQQPS